VIVLDIPSASCIPSLLSSFKSSAYYRRFWSEDHALLKTKDYSVRTVYHMCGDGVLEDEDYKAFMNGFSSDSHVCAFSSYFGDKD
jgi:ribonuclease Z